MLCCTLKGLCLHNAKAEGTPALTLLPMLLYNAGGACSTLCELLSSSWLCILAEPKRLQASLLSRPQLGNGQQGRQP